MSFFGRRTARQVDLALLILRLALGAVFIAHGGQKLFVYGLEGVTDSFGKMGVPAASVMGPVVAFVELLGGVAIVLGLLARLAALGIACVMIGAIALVHLPNGFFLPQGIEFTLVLLASALALVLTGAGRYSIDAIMGRRVEVGSRAVEERRPRRRAA